MHYKDIYDEILPFNEFTSDKVVINKNALDKTLSQNNYFKPNYGY